MANFRPNSNAEQSLGEVTRSPNLPPRQPNNNPNQQVPIVASPPQTRIQIGSPRRGSEVHRDLMMTDFYEQNPAFRARAPDVGALMEVAARQDRPSRQEVNPIDQKEGDGWGLDVHYMEEVRNPNAGLNTSMADSQRSPRTRGSPRCMTHTGHGDGRSAGASTKRS
eukprot:GEMP01085990.1.p2 GENE.GEMP01085990.1~~GEMP01085990.1.p2  ORF type:complete len:166 (+),score=19.52 GEMP01085990.1:111-608(+)